MEFSSDCSPTMHRSAIVQRSGNERVNNFETLFSLLLSCKKTEKKRSGHFFRMREHLTDVSCTTSRNAIFCTGTGHFALLRLRGVCRCLVVVFVSVSFLFFWILIILNGFLCRLGESLDFVALCM